MGVYIFIGPELGRRQEAANAVKERYKKGTTAEEFTFYADDTSVGTIVDTLQNQGLFADARIVTVKNAEAIKKKDDVDYLVSFSKKIKENTALILLSDEIRLAAGFDNAKANKQVFYEMFESDKIKWLQDFFRRSGFNINKDCIDIILEMVENNTDALKRECTRLIYFFPKDQPINAQDIEKWLSHNREESAFTLFSRIAAGDLGKSLEALNVMLAAKTSAQKILSGLAWCFRKLGDYLSLLEAGNANNSFELKKIGLSSPKTKNDYAAAARRYNIESAEACLALTARYEILLRSPAAVMENIIMDKYILALIKAGSV
ncbi:MAG: DNA polymerase III subunit delta [Treponema sp.]|nr:DNA polymerase III subunit delta [Treponema sp.]